MIASTNNRGTEISCVSDISFEVFNCAYSIMRITIWSIRRIWVECGILRFQGNDIISIIIEQKTSDYVVF